MNNKSNNSVLSVSTLLDFFNLDPNMVLKCESNRDVNGLSIYITLIKNVHRCPSCNNSTSTIKDYTIKKIKHSILNLERCHIIYRARRYLCTVCKKTFYERNPFVVKNSKISSVTVYNVLQDLKNSTETFTSVAKRYFLSTTTVSSIFDKNVNISRRTFPEIISIDEVYAFKGNRSNYACVLLDFKAQKVIDILPSRRKEDLIRYLSFIPRDERLNVKFASTDMWETYRIVFKTYFPNATIVVDKFHVLQDLSRRLMKVRSKILNEIKPPTNINKDNLSYKEKKELEIRENNYYLLKKFSWLIFKPEPHDPNAEKKYNKKLNRYLNFYDIHTLLLEIHDDLKLIDNSISLISRFYRNCTLDNAKATLTEIIKVFKSSYLRELNDFANTLIRWKSEIIASFTIVGTKIIQERIDGRKVDKTVNVKLTNGIIEGRNKVIKTIKRNANGYGNWLRFRNRVLYVLNSDTTFNINPLINDNEDTNY